eukprot:scaffold522746_cov38-Prasinocladus_malaysianus.AAC.1
MHHQMRRTSYHSYPAAGRTHRYGTISAYHDLAFKPRLYEYQGRPMVMLQSTYNNAAARAQNSAIKRRTAPRRGGDRLRFDRNRQAQA